MQRPVLTSIAALGLLVTLGSAQGEDLMDVYRVAQAKDPRLAAAEAAHRAAVEAKPQARSLLLPALNAQAAQTSIDSDRNGNYTNSNYSLNLQQALYHHDYWLLLRQADSRVAQADAQLGSARQDLITRVATSYFLVLAAKDNLEFAEAEKTSIGQQLRQTQQRFEVGLTAVTDVREAQARYDLAVAQEIAARNQLDIANELLREITGRAFADLAPLGADMPLLVPEPEDIEQWVDTAVQQNLELIAAEAQTDVARQEVGRQRATRYPSLDLVASYGHSEQGAFAFEDDATTVGIQLNFPFYQGGAITSRTREAAALYGQAQELRELQRRATVRQTRDAFLNIRAGISQVLALRQALASAQTALEATQAGYDVGTRTAVDVLDAQRELFRARRDYARSRYDYILSTLRLKQAAGTLTPTDVAQINAWLQ